MNESFEELVNRYKQELMRYVPASSSPAVSPPPTAPQPSPPLPSAPPLAVPPDEPSLPVTCRGDLTDEGSLQIMLTTARQSFPLPDGYVTITCRTSTGENLLYFLESNIDGRTALVPLPAPDRQLSESPGNATPYALYDVRADHSGYATVQIRNTQVFGGIVADLPIDMIPAASPSVMEFDLLSQHTRTEGGDPS